MFNHIQMLAENSLNNPAKLVVYIVSGRAGRAFLQALRVTRARVLSFPLRVPACFFKAFFSRTKIRVPAFSRSKFSFVFLFRALQLKNISRS